MKTSKLNSPSCSPPPPSGQNTCAAFTSPVRSNSLFLAGCPVSRSFPSSADTPPLSFSFKVGARREVGKKEKEKKKKMRPIRKLEHNPTSPGPAVSTYCLSHCLLLSVDVCYPSSSLAVQPPNLFTQHPLPPNPPHPVNSVCSHLYRPQNNECSVSELLQAKCLAAGRLYAGGTCTLYMHVRYAYLLN